MRRRIRPLFLLASLAIAVVLFSGTASAQPQNNTTEQDGGPQRTIDRAPSGAPIAGGELIVTFESTASIAGLEDLRGQFGAEVMEKLPQMDAEVISFPRLKDGPAGEAQSRLLEEVRKSLEATPLVESAEYNYLRKPSATPNDPRFSSQYGVKKINAPQAWDTTRGAGAQIAVVDSGIDSDHPDLSAKIAAQRDFVNEDGVAEDATGHGTAVSGVAAASTGNATGVAGICPECGLIAAKALGPRGGFDSNIAQAITWGANSGAEVISLSLAGPRDSAVLERAIQQASSGGSVVVAAAGNGGTSRPSYPAAYPSTVSVSTTDSSDQRASFSSFGQSVDVAAPGVEITTTFAGGGYGAASGTSFSAPFVAGEAGLLAGQGLSGTGIEARIRESADDLGPEGEDPFYGAGRIDAAAAVVGGSGENDSETGDGEPVPESAPGLAEGILGRIGQSANGLE